MNTEDSQYLTVNGRRYYYDADFDVYRRLPNDSATPDPRLTVFVFLALLAATLFVILR